MGFGLSRSAVVVLLAACYLGTSVASAAPVSVLDNYWGGNGSADIIGDANVFGISGATVERLNANTLSVVIHTSYAGRPGTTAALSTGYGSLFFGPQISLPTGAASTTDTWANNQGRFTHVFDISNSYPGSGTQTGLTGNLYEVDPAKVIQSYAPPGYTFRSGQAVQYNEIGETPVLGTSGSWSIPDLFSISFLILDNGTLGDSFLLGWAMTCANDIILANVTLPPGGSSQVPIPAALPLLAAGLGAFGLIATRRKRHQLA